VSGVSAAVTGMLQVEWNNEETSEAMIRQYLDEFGVENISAVNSLRGSAREEEHGPAYLHLLGSNTELYFAAISGVCWFAGVVLGFVTAVPTEIPTGLYMVGALFGGYFTFLTAGQDLLRGKFEIDFLMLFAAVGAAALGKWAEAALLLFLFSLGHALEHYAMQRARKSIAALSELTPAVALLKEGETIREIPVEKLTVGDIILVKPNSKIAADGEVVSGASAVNQAPITGESVPVEKFAAASGAPPADYGKLPAEHRAFAGTINGSGALEIRVLRKAEDSTLARLITLVREAETQKSPTQHLADNFEKYYVPAVIVVVVVDETFQESFYRAMSVLIAASPCALAISTPSAVLAGISRAARQGVLIKGGRPLEDLGAFDKTGTLTEGKPKLTAVVPFGTTSREHLLEVAVAVETLSDHPLADAIVEGGRKALKGRSVAAAANLKAFTARGVSAEWQGSTVRIGNRRMFEELTGKPVPGVIDEEMRKLESAGQTAMIVHQKGEYLGVVAVMDVARSEARETLEALKRLGIGRMVMLTGDNQQVADAIAAEIGITDPLGNLLPEDKVAAIDRLRDELGWVGMVGDGVNDAPAMAKSTIGIAMGAAGSDVALETADVALMADKLDNLPFAIGLSRKARRIIKQNLVISLGMVAVLVPLTVMGTVAIGPAVVGHEGSTVLVVLNALRLLRYEQ